MQSWGGNGGTAFDARVTIYSGETWKKLSAVMIREGAIDEYITGVRIKSGNKVDNITFITNKNVYTYVDPAGQILFSALFNVLFYLFKKVRRYDK
ncbi:MAG: hypothetical protein LBS88_09420 [Tannerellaceae bacterium]|jgi:hypothetical protein|nr:hypothetical protein [Tannerellaceae bacterium]